MATENHSPSENANSFTRSQAGIQRLGETFLDARFRGHDRPVVSGPSVAILRSVSDLRLIGDPPEALLASEYHEHVEDAR
jgi:hypothetical protein